MLNTSQLRPKSATTIYRRDVDLAVIESQIRQRNALLDTAFANGDITLSVREPTKSLMAAVVVNTSNLDFQWSDIGSTLAQSAKDMGFGSGALGIDLPNQRIEIPIEMYEPSAFVKQISYIVSDLPD